MDLSKCKWKAVHSDKTVILPNYVDVNRKTLQSVSLDDIIIIERPDVSPKWLISWRMRSQLENGILARRFWIFNDRTRGKITRVHEDGKIDVVNNWEELQIKPATITNIDEL